MTRHIVLVLVAALLVIFLSCGIVSAAEITLDQGKYSEGEPIHITGTNAISNATHLSVCIVGSDDCEEGVAPTKPDTTWEYTLTKNTGFGAKRIDVWTTANKTGPSHENWIIMISRETNKTERSTSGAGIYTQTPKPTQTAKPTEDYSAKIAKLESKISDLEEQYIPPTITPIPTATVNHSATIAALEAQISAQQAELTQQKGILETILAFLGLA